LSNNHISPSDKALGFIQGLLCGAEKLTQVAYLRRDPVVPEIVGIKRIASQSVLSRFFAGFDSEGKNQQCFGALWKRCIARLKPRAGGYSLDFDSTRLLHEDGHQEGVATGCTRTGIKPCLHPFPVRRVECRRRRQAPLRIPLSANVPPHWCARVR